jgi:hypothetical protein
MAVKYSSILFYSTMVSPPLQHISMNNQTIFTGRKQKNIGADAMGHSRLHEENGEHTVQPLKMPIANGNKYLSRLESWQRTPINIISPSMFHLSSVGNGNRDMSSKEHFKNLKTKRGSYLLLELFIFVHVHSVS